MTKPLRVKKPQLSRPTNEESQDEEDGYVAIRAASLFSTFAIIVFLSFMFQSFEMIQVVNLRLS